jgi:hypothetical protein
VLQSYKTAKDHIVNTGSGLHGIAHSNYIDSVVDKHCRYYYILDPVLGQRPNVKPWFTNEDEDDDLDNYNKESLEQDEYDNESDATLDGNLCIDVQKEIEELTNMGKTTYTIIPSSPKKRSQVLNLSASEDSITLVEPYDTSEVPGSGSKSCINISNSDGSTTNTSSNSGGVQNECSTKAVIPIRSRNKVVKKKPKLSPSAAMNMQKSLLRKKKMQINSRSDQSKMSEVLSNEVKEREFLMQVRKSKLELERERHDDLKNIELKKIMMEEKRLKIDSDEGSLKREQIMAQTLLEKNKALLVKMEIFKTRQAIKKADPSITDEFLDKEFPYSS